MKKLFAFLTIICLLSLGISFAQDQSKGQILLDAELFYGQGNYIDALPLYSVLDSMEPSIEYKFKLGVCYLYRTDKLKLSSEYLEMVLEKKPKTENLHFYLGRSYALNNKFDEAIESFNKALNGKTSKENLESIERYIGYCGNGKKLVENPIDVTIENMGRPVNSKYSEYVPVISADESVMIYTYRGGKSTGGRQNVYAEPDPKGRFYEDVFMSVKLGGETWSDPEKIGENINTHGHDASLAISANGQKLFIYKDTEGSSGDIYISELKGYEWSVPKALDSNINTTSWEGGVSLSADESSLYFSSERPGGIGGRDLYKCMRNTDGSWGKPKNLGPKINTPFDDESPFIHPDGKTLFFSSEGHQSMGGYDIFRSLVITDSSWTTPENIGYPINTTGDDRYYVVSANGERGYYSSQKIGGYGQHDIYVVHLGDVSKKYQLILIKGTVTANDVPVEADITVKYADSKLPYDGYFKSNSATGKYIVILPGETNYNLSYNVKGFDPHIENIDASAIDIYTEIVKDVKLYSNEYQKTMNISGTLLTGKDLNPASGITLYFSSAEGSLSLNTVIDEKGAFAFNNIPTGNSYVFSISEDANVSKARIEGVVSSSDQPKPGINFALKEGNETDSKQDGTFILEILPNTPKDCEFPIHLLKPFTGGSTFPDLSDEIYQKIILKYGGCVADGLVFKVQIGAYFTPENFNFSYFNQLGNVSTQLLKDGITRFVMGKYKKMNGAESLKNKAIRIGDKDAFIVIFYKGERMMISDAIKKEF